MQEYVRTQVSDQRREARKIARSLFFAADKDGSGEEAAQDGEAGAGAEAEAEAVVEAKK